MLYQLADVCELVGERQKAAEWFVQLLSVVPRDAGVLRRLGQLYDADGDVNQALHYFLDSHRQDPSNVAVVEWLGNYYIESQLVETVNRQFFLPRDAVSKRGHCCRPVSVRPSVRLSVCLSHWWTVSTQLKISSNFLFGPVAPSF